MLRLYQRFKQSNLSRAVFCREEGLTAAQFTYWCRRFEQESTPDEASPPSITLSQLSTPIQAVQEPVEREALAANPVAEPTPPAIPGFTQLHLSAPATHPLIVIGPGTERTGRVLHASRSFISQNVTGLNMLALSSSCRYFLYQKGAWTSNARFDRQVLWNLLAGWAGKKRTSAEPFGPQIKSDDLI